MIASGLVVAAIALPWLILLPLHGAVAVLAHAATLAAAFHGAGLTVARLAGQRAAPPLLIAQWGLAALIGLSGIAIAVHAGTLATHAVLLFGFAAVHTCSLGMRFARHVERVAEQLAGPRGHLVPAALLAALGTLAVLGAAGDPTARPFDDEGNVLAQLRRVLETGALGDPIGYPRTAQLGAQIALAAIASGAGDGFTRILEPLAQILALGLALSRIRAAGASSAPWAVVLIVTAYALALAPVDPLPCWTAVGLALALYTMLGELEPPPALPLALTAGALLALRYELAPIAAVAVAAAWSRRPRAHRTTAVVIGGALAVCAPFAISRAVAWHAVPQLAAAALAPPAQAALALRLVLAAAIAAPAAGVLRLVLPGNRELKWPAIATAVALGALAAQLTGTGAYSMRLAWPIAIGFAISLVIELARGTWSGPTALITSFVLCLFIYEGREASGRLRWSHRAEAAAEAIEAVQRPPSDAADPYTAVLAGVPAGSTVAVWVTEPERLDYTRLRIVDLRTPAGARLREHRFRDHRSELAAVVTAVAASFVLIERDDAHVRRTQTDLLYRALCQSMGQSVGQTALPICADDLEALALDHPIVARNGSLVLVALGH